MKQGRRKKVVGGFVLVFFSAFLLVQNGWALTAPLDPLVMEQGTSGTASVGGDTMPDATSVTEETSASDPLRSIVTKLFLRVGVVANTLVVLGQTSLQTIHDFLTGDVTVTKSVTSTRYDSLGRAIAQTGSSESTTESENGTVSKSRTALTFDLSAASGGFVVTKQVTNTNTVDPGAVTEDTFDADGKKIVDERWDDTVTRQTTTITRDYDERGFLMSAEGVISNGSTRTGRFDTTTFTGDIEFAVCKGVNQECLTEQTTISKNTSSLRAEITTTTSTLLQENDAFGRIISGQAVAESVTTPRTQPKDGEIKTISASTTYFVAADTNTLAAYRTLTESTSTDTTEAGQSQGYSTSTQEVLIDLQGYDEASTQRTGEITGRVLDASGTLSSISFNVPEAWDGTPLTTDYKNNEATNITKTNGTLGFTVINNQILNDVTDIGIDSLDVANNIKTLQTQHIEQSYNEVGVGTTGHITTEATTTSLGALDFKDEDGDGKVTFFDLASGKWVIDVIDGTTDRTVETVSQTEIITKFIGGQFLATDIASASVSKEYTNPNDKEKASSVSTNVTYTHQDYTIDGKLVNPLPADDHHPVGDPNDLGKDYVHQGSRIELLENYTMDLVGLSAGDRAILEGLTPEMLLAYYLDDNGSLDPSVLDPNGHPIPRVDIFTFGSPTP